MGVVSLGLVLSLFWTSALRAGRVTAWNLEGLQEIRDVPMWRWFLSHGHMVSGVFETLTSPKVPSKLDY